jgi:site-specific DNA-methyltransferase (adenine-specific)
MTDSQSIVMNCDCMEYMSTIPDNFFELAVVDPPYAVGASDGNFGGKKSAPSRISGKVNGKNYTNFDKIPDKEYFDELFRISKNQIIWGSNYYPQYLYGSGAIIWDKKNDKNHVLSDCEIAFQSLSKLVNIVRIAWGGFYKEDSNEMLKYRVHPNQKPVNLYNWTYLNYAKPGDKIFDSHMGSQSSRIAAYDMGFDYWGCELDADYFRDGCKRYENHIAQQVMQFPDPEPLPEQTKLSLF